MPSWTLAELASNATRRIGQRADITMSECSFWANQAQEDLVRDVPELLSERTAWFSVDSGTSLLTIPADFYHAINLSHQTTGSGSGRTVRQVEANWADAQGYYPVGEPQGYFIFNDKIQLWPSANSSANTTGSSGRSYQLRYYANPTNLSTTTSVPSVVTMHRIGILYKLEEYLNELVGNSEEAAAANIRYLGFVSSLKDSMARRQAEKGSKRISMPLRQSRGAASFDGGDEWYRR